MKKGLFLAWSILVFPFFAAAATFESGGTLTNLYWAPTKTADAAGYTMNGSDLFWQVQGSLTQELSDGVQFKGGIEEDPVLKRRLYAQLGFDMNSLNIQFTPFIGFLNTSQKWFNPGLEAAVQYTFPGIAFLKAGFSTSFAPLAKEGDYYIASEFASAGWFMGSGIVTLTAQDKGATVRGAGGTDTINSSATYLLDTEIFVKNFPLRPAISVGYQLTSRIYVKGATQNETPLHSALLGGRLVLDVGQSFSLYLNGLMSLFNFATLDTRLAVPDSSLLYQVQSGVRFQL